MFQKQTKGMAELKYTYALDESKTSLIHIDDAQQGQVYYCPNSECNERMTVKDGGHNRNHFSHVKNGDKCSYDNYLHTIAIIKIADWFISGNEIQIQFNSESRCSKYKDCIWNGKHIEEHYDCKHRHLSNPIRIKEYYNAIKVEEKYKGFKWDLLLCHTEKVNRPPLAIEILVTHPCEDNKKESGVKTIEIRIKSEDQLNRIISTGMLIEGNHFSAYNIKKELVDDKVDGTRLNKVFLNDKMKALWKLVDCKSYEKRRSDSIFEITFDRCIAAEQTSFFNSYYWACAILRIKFKDFIHCSLCRSYVYNQAHNQHICKNYKLLKLADNHDPANAVNCPMFRINNQYIYESKDKLKYLSYNVWKRGDGIEGKSFKRQIEDLE